MAISPNEPWLAHNPPRAIDTLWLSIKQKLNDSVAQRNFEVKWIFRFGNRAEQNSANIQ